MDFKQAIQLMKKHLTNGQEIGGMAETAEYYIFWVGTRKELDGDPNVGNDAVTVMDKQSGKIGYWSFLKYCDAVDANEVRWIDMTTGKREIPG